MPKYLTSSTLWYSGIFAAAATFDAGVKKERREQWERAIADVKQDLGQQANASKVKLKDTQEAAQSTLDEDTIQWKPFTDLLENEDIFRYTDPRRKKPRWPANTGLPLKLKHLPPESIYATDERKEVALNARWSAKKLASVQTSIEILQLRIFQTLQYRNWSREAATAVSDPDFAAHILQSPDRIERLRLSKLDMLETIKTSDSTLCDYKHPEQLISLCNFKQDDSGRYHETARELNSSIQELFKRRMNQSISQPVLLANLAYNLSLSSAPPNLNTFNTILLGLGQVEEPKLVNHVIASMCDTHIRMNEVSLSTILNHYTKTDDVSNFVRMVQRMRGMHNGLALARGSIRISEKGAARLKRNPDQPWKIIQLPYPTPVVFDRVISGMVKFGGFDAALAVCQGMGSEGWSLCMTGLTPLLNDCAARHDWTSGLAVWKQIQDIKFKSRIRNGPRLISERIPVGSFAAMLKLCSNCNKEESFDDIWVQASEAYMKPAERIGQLRARKEKHTKSVESIANLELAESSDVDHRTVPKGGNDQIPHFDKEKSTSEQLSMEFKEQKPITDRLNSLEDIETQRSHAAISTEALGASISAKERPSDSIIPRRTPSSKRQSLTHRLVTKPQRSPLLEEQLFGMLPPSHELDEYELGERPMALYA